MFLCSFVVASIVSLAAGHCVREYAVKEGDYCDKISAAQGVSTYQLAVINYGIVNEDCTNITPGQKICLGYQGEDCTTVYTVVKGDTCDAIATTHNINTTLLYENNPQIDAECSNIYVGEVLCVASKVIVPPPAGDKPLSVPSTAVLAPPTKTPAPSPSPSPSPLPSNTTPDYEDDEDDEDLPYCDEL
jgi:LysM repeat protein